MTTSRFSRISVLVDPITHRRLVRIIGKGQFSAWVRVRMREAVAAKAKERDGTN